MTTNDHALLRSMGIAPVGELRIVVRNGQYELIEFENHQLRPHDYWTAGYDAARHSAEFAALRRSARTVTGLD